MKLPKLHIGTSGWSYKHWYQVFYPPEIRPDKFLEPCITEFSCVELNSSFYHLPKAATIAGWINRTPESFRFCAKLSRFITHQKKLREPDAPLKKFFELFAPMIPRLGPVLIQLPPGLSYSSSLIDNFLQTLSRDYSQYRFAVEVRHQTWIHEEFLQLLSDYQTAFVIADSGKRFPSHEAVTTDFVYLRFHSRGNLYASEYTEDELWQYAGKIRGWMNEGKAVWAFFNNDYHGYAVQNAKRLLEMMS